MMFGRMGRKKRKKNRNTFSELKTSLSFFYVGMLCTAFIGASIRVPCGGRWIVSVESAPELREKPAEEH